MSQGMQAERKRRIVATRKADEDRPPPVASTKVVTVDERRNVMRHLPDPKQFPGESESWPRFLHAWCCGDTSPPFFCVPIAVTGTAEGTFCPRCGGINATRVAKSLCAHGCFPGGPYAKRFAYARCFHVSPLFFCGSAFWLSPRDVLPEIMSLMKAEVKKDLREMEFRDVLFAKR